MAGKLTGNAISNQTITSSKITSSLSNVLSGNASSGILVTELQYPDTSNSVSIFGGQTVTLIGSGFEETTNVFMNGVNCSNVTYINASAISFETISVTSDIFFTFDIEPEKVKDYSIHLLNSDGTTYEVSPPISVRSLFVNTNFGYVSGGSAPTRSNVIDKFPFSSDANATDVGDLTEARFGVAGQSSDVSGYTSGGWRAPGPPFPTVSNVIDKFPFATDANATDVGDLSQLRYYASGTGSADHGFTFGGGGYTPPTVFARYTTIDRFPFSTNSNASKVADLSPAVGLQNTTATRSAENAFIYGGTPPSTVFPINRDVTKFNFATSTVSIAIQTSLRRRSTAGAETPTHVYYLGGDATSLNPPYSPPAVTANIFKFPFASLDATTSVGNLTQARSTSAGHSSAISGYGSGGSAPGLSNIIDKFPFASDANASDVGDLSVTRAAVAGQEY